MLNCARAEIMSSLDFFTVIFKHLAKKSKPTLRISRTLIFFFISGTENFEYTKTHFLYIIVEFSHLFSAFWSEDVLFVER